MKKLIAMLVGAALIGGCHGARPSSGPTAAAGPTTPGAADATAAVRAYLRSVEQQDLQAMGAVWGGPDGPARDLLGRDELYQREFVMMCALKHDRYDIVGDAENTTGGRSVVVNLFSGSDSHSHTFDVVPGPQGRWYVRSVDLKTVSTCGKT